MWNVVEILQVAAALLRQVNSGFRLCAVLVVILLTNTGCSGLGHRPVDRKHKNDGKVSIEGDLEYTNHSSVNLLMKDETATEMYLTAEAGCASGGSWEPYQDRVPWALPVMNGESRLFVKFRDSKKSESECVEVSIIHDNIAPTVTISSPAAMSYVNLGNKSSFGTIGSCSESERAVSISGDATKTVPCTGGVWSANLDFSSAVDGNVNVFIDHVDAAGNTAVQASRTFVKDTQPPLNPTVSIEGGAATTSSATVNLTLSADGASEMYITNVSGCASGGSWEAYGTSKNSWSLGQANGSATVYARYRDVAGNMTACVSDSITQDSSAPSLASVTVTNSDPTASTTYNLSYGTLSETIASYCILENDTTQSDCSWVTASSLPTSFTVDSTNEAKVLSVWVKDAVGLTSTRVDSNSVTLDTSAPSLASVTVTNASPTKSTTYNLSYGALSGSISNYCILENDPVVSNCSWTSATSLPTSYTVDATNEAKVLSVWVKNSGGFVSTRVDSNSVTLDTVAPVNPTFTSISPASPSSNSAPKVIGSASVDSTTVSLYDSSSCANEIGSNTKAIFEGAGITASVAANATTSIYALAFDAAGNSSSCVSFTSYVHDNVAPTLASATVTNSDPTSSTTYALSFGALSESIAKYCILENDTTVGDCTWTSATSLPASYTVDSTNEAKVLSIWVQDAAGNTSAKADTNSVTLDTSGLSVASFTITNASPTRSTTYNLTYGTVSGSITAYCINENDTDVNNCSWVSSATLPSSFTVSSTNEAKILSLWVKNASATVSSRTDSNSVTLDTVAPTLASVDISNTSPTRSTTYNLSYGASSETVASYCILENDTTLADCTFVDGALPSSFTVDATNEAKILSVWIKDAAGNTSARVASDSVTLDTVVPTLASATISDSSPANSTTFHLVYGAVSESISAYCINENDVDSANCTWTSATSLPATYVVSSTNEAKVLSIWIKDDAGNTGARVATNSVTLDNGLPTLASVTVTNSSPTRLTSYSLSFGALSESISAYCILENDVDDTNCTWTSSTTLPASFTVSSTNNAKVLSVWVKDDAANMSARADSNSVTLDTVVPTLASATVTNSDPSSSTTYNLSYGALSESIAQYCILENDTTLANCSFTSGTSLPATYTVDATNEAKVLSIWVKDAAGNTSARVDANSVTLDNSAPTLASVSVTNASPTKSTSYNLSYGAQSGSYDRYCIRENDTDVANCTFVAGTLPSTFTVNTTNEAKVLSVWLKDSLGNTSTRVDSNSVTLDTVLPTLASATVTNSSPTTSTTFNLTYGALGETIASYCILLNDTDSANCSWTSATSLPASFTVSSTSEAKVLSIWVKDAAGNQSTRVDTNSVTLDNSGPSVTINQAASQSDPTTAQTIDFDLVFSEAIDTSTLTNGDIVQNGTASGITWAITNSGDDRNFTVSTSAITGDGTVEPSLAAGAVKDALGNSSSASTSTDGVVTYNSAPANGATQLALAGPANVKSSTCSAAFTVTAQDSGGIATNVSSNTTVNLTETGGGSFYSNSSCSSAITSVSIAAGTSTQTFYFMDPTVETANVSVAASGLGSTQMNVVVGSTTVPTKLAWSGPTALTAGTCSTAYTLTTRDATNTLTNVASSTVVDLSSGGAGSFYTDSTCQTAVTQTTFASGSNTKTLYFKDLSAESLILAASSGSLNTGTLSIAVGAGSAIKLTISGASTLSPGSCSSAFTVKSRDSYNNLAGVSSATTVNLSGNGSGTFYSDAGCSSSISSLSFGSATSTGTFYFKDSTAETLHLTASATGLESGIQILNIPAGAPSKLGWVGSSVLTASQCASYTVTTQDSAGNAVNALSATSVTLASSGSGAFYSNSGCTTPTGSLNIAQGSSSAGVYFKDSVAESAVLSASSDVSSGLSTGTLTVTMNSAKLTIAGSTSISTSTCTAYTVSNQNGAGTNVNVTGSTLAVSLGGSGSGFFYSASNCTNGAKITSVNIGVGAATATFYFKDTSAQYVTLQASATNRSTGTLGVSVGGAAAPDAGGSSPLLAVTGPSSVATGTCGGPYTITSQDSLGAALNVGSSTTVTLSGKGSGTFYSNSGCTISVTSATIAAGGNSTSFYFEDSVVESLYLAASATNYTTGYAAVTTTATTPVRLTISGTTQLMKNLCAPYTLRSINSDGNVAAVSADVTLRLGGDSYGAFYSNSNCSTEITQATLASGSGEIGVYYMDPEFESSLTLSVSDSASVLAPGYVNVQMTGPTRVTTGLWGRSCAIVGTGLQCWGDGDQGEMGNGAYDSPKSPVWVSTTGTVTAVSSGMSHVCAVVSGAAKCWGANFDGQLGTGGTTPSATPQQVSGLTSGVVDIAAGQYHTCALKSDGTVWCWGYNFSGQVGNNSTTTNFYTPQQVSNIASGTTAIAVGTEHSCAIVNGSAKCWGLNYGQLGDGTQNDSSVPVQVSGITSGATAISAGEQHSCAVVSGAVKCWGTNGFGQLGNNTTTNTTTPVDATGLASGVTAIATGTTHNCAIKDGGAWCWGSNGSGQLGDGTTTTSKIAIAVSGLSSGVTAIDAAQDVSCAVASGDVMCWGNNNDGELGGSTLATERSSSPVEMSTLASSVSQVSNGNQHSCVLLSDGSVQCTGYNSESELGDGGTTSSFVPVQSSGLLSGATSVSAGYQHSCATVGGLVKCWGANSSGQIGNGTSGSNVSTPTTVSGIAANATYVAAGSDSSCAVVNGGVQCWGANGSGQLGNGSTTQSTTPVTAIAASSSATLVSVGQNFACAIVNGAAKCWGSNGNGQLGDNSTTMKSSPTDVSGLSSGVTAISVGATHTCAVHNGAAKCWGSNNNGQLGDGSTNESHVPITVSGLSSGVVSIAAGSEHSCAVLGTGVVKCWGNNPDGRLGDGSVISSLSPVTVSGISTALEVSANQSTSCARLSDGSAWCWGLNTFGPLGSPDAIYIYRTPVVAGPFAP